MENFMGYKQPQAQLLVITEHKDANGNNREELTTIPGPVLPWRVVKRSTWAHRVGLGYVRSLARRMPWDVEGVRAITVSDGKRDLASWKFMEQQGGYTGTHEVHPLVAEQLR